VAFEPTTNQISNQESGGFLADCGLEFLNKLKNGSYGGPERLARDWRVVQAWLSCQGRELNAFDYTRFGIMFRSYLARGLAPSETLDRAFKKFAQMAKDEQWQTPPVPAYLVPIFNRLLADQETQRKLVADSTRRPDAVNAKAASQSHTENSKKTVPAVQLNWIPLVTSIAMLIAAVTGDWPYGFYQLLRIVVCGTAIYAVVQTLNRQYWPWILGGLAILFNPFLPVSFEREEWQPIDFGAAIVFLIALIQMRPRSTSSTSSAA
jgi:hypothetical protein